MGKWGASEWGKEDESGRMRRKTKEPRGVTVKGLGVGGKGNGEGEGVVFFVVGVNFLFPFSWEIGSIAILVGEFSRRNGLLELHSSLLSKFP